MKTVISLLFLLLLIQQPLAWSQPDIALQVARIDSMSDNDKAILSYQLMLRERSDLDAKTRIKILNHMGQRYFGKGDNGALIRYLDQACKLAIKAGLNREVSALYNNLGIGYQSAGLYDSSLWYYQRSVAAATKYGTTISAAKPWLNMGLLYNRLKRYAPAIGAYNKAHMIAVAQKDTAMLAACYLNLGALYAGRYTPDSLGKAKLLLEEALQLTRRQGYDDIKHKANYSLGLMMENNGRPSEAVPYYEAARNIPISEYDDCIPLLSLGHAYLKMGQLRKAQRALDSGLAKARRMVPAPDYLCDFYLYYAQLLRAQKKPEQAAAFYEQYIDLSDSLRGAQTQARIDRLQREYESEKRDNELVKKELVISRQQAALQRKNMIVCAIIILGATAIALMAWYGRGRRRKQRLQQEKAVWVATFEGEERERQRISRELHDGIGGALSNARRWFATIGSEHPHLLRESDYGQALDLLDGTLADVRQTAHRLMPQWLLKHGLVKAVELYCLQARRATSKNISFEYLGYVGEMGHRLHLMLYRCIQELLENAVRHSGASIILVQLSGHDDLLQVTVEDNGNGFDASAAEAGIGMAHITRGIEHIGGKVDIRTAPGKGTSITFELKYA
ncbi:Signal transduction histidine kinase [Chitinophaga eiseniae]|uniref:Oxygen sensor histidine kinase NreB n=2 Tax=Chitinophaga eiseniae TaxID=634771 RepID=A0A1T4SX95_9BACT|nr:Signal transduction histidine kinase [Chitinophaga eiseniae]